MTYGSEDLASQLYAESELHHRSSATPSSSHVCGRVCALTSDNSRGLGLPADNSSGGEARIVPESLNPTPAAHASQSPPPGQDFSLNLAVDGRQPRPAAVRRRSASAAAAPVSCPSAARRARLDPATRMEARV